MHVVKDELLLSVDGFDLHRLKYCNDVHFLYIRKEGKRIPVPQEFTFISTDEEFCDVNEVYRNLLEFYPMSLRFRHVVMYKGELIMAFERRFSHDIIGFHSVAEEKGVVYHPVDELDEEIDFNPNDPDYVRSLTQSHQKHQNTPFVLSAHQQ